MKSLHFFLFFDIIAAAVDAFLHAVYHLLYARVIEVSRRVKILWMVVLLTSGIISQSSRTVTLRSFSISASTFAIVSSETDGRPERCSSWTSVRPSLNSLHHLRTCCMLRRLHTIGNEFPPVQCFLHTKNELQSVTHTRRAKRWELHL